MFFTKSYTLALIILVRVIKPPKLWERDRDRTFPLCFSLSNTHTHTHTLTTALLENISFCLVGFQ